MAHVRDRPSLRESVEITTPSGNRYRWGDDEDSPMNVPSGERFTDTMPGGFAEHEAVLPRKPSVDYSDLERLSTLTRYDASGGIIWQGRLERAPKVSGDQMAISPSAVGWQAHLEDDKSATMVYIDRDLGRWTSPSRQRRLSLIASNSPHQVDASATADSVSGLPALHLEIQNGWASPHLPRCEAWYDAGAGVGAEAVHYNFSGDPSTNFSLTVFSSDADDSTDENSADLYTAATGFGTYTPATPRRYIGLAWNYTATPGGADGAVYYVDMTFLAVTGNHGLALISDGVTSGYYASGIVTHAVERWAPLLTVTSETITRSAFIVPQVAFLEPTTAGEIIRQTTRYGLQDWAVWEDLTFWWHERGARGKRWCARTGPSQLEETGPQVERIWESVIVQYQDVDGSTRTVGPVGSGADTETNDLKDDDPDNPANKLGITRRTLLVMGIGTAASATEIGRRFLEESKLLDSSGRARLVGHVQDSHGVWHPYSHVRAGDTISFVDSSDTSPRRCVRTDKNREDRSCSVDLDAPPEGLAALLERLGVVLVPLGV